MEKAAASAAAFDTPARAEAVGNARVAAIGELTFSAGTVIEVDGGRPLI